MCFSGWNFQEPIDAKDLYIDNCSNCRYNRNFKCISLYAKLQNYKNCFILKEKEVSKNE